MIDANATACTACGACVQKCPKQCIELQSDINGFLYPQIQVAECVSCGLCEKVCPIGDKQSLLCSQTAYACVNKDASMLKQETSGGVFGTIATYFLDNGGVVYGCAYVGHLQATHIRVNNKKLLTQLFGSKYVQSNTCNTFKECEKDLKDGKPVLYSGTPCQVSGLKKYLQKDYENLFTVDIICHGVASQDYFDKFVEYLERQEKATCLDYNFRSKKNAGWSCAGVARFRTKTGKDYEKKQYYFSNYYYYYYYLSCATYRESCYQCPYASMNRVGDFTLGDFWGVEGLTLSFSIDGGCSLVLVNTPKAANLFNKLDLNKQAVSLETAKKYNKQLSSPSKPLCDRDELLSEYREKTAEEIQRNFKYRNKEKIFFSKIKYCVPQWLKKILLKRRYR